MAVSTRLIAGAMLLLCAPLQMECALALEQGTYTVQQCSNENYRAHRIALLAKGFADSVREIEGVPPEEADFLNQEAAATPGQLSHIVLSNRYWYPLKVQEAKDTLLQELDLARTAKTPKIQADDLFQAYAIARDLEYAVERYVIFDANRAITIEEGGQITHSLIMTEGLLLELFHCVLSQWP